MALQRQQFESALQKLREALIDMGKKVEEAIFESVEALRTNDMAKAKLVIERDPELNKMEEDIGEMGTRLIALQQPVAKDLRKILISFKMAADLERIGDLAVDIAKTALRINGEPLIKPLVDIPRMAEIVQTMTNDSIRAYIDENVDLAYEMAKMDDEVDHLHSQIMREMFSYMMENPRNLNQAMLLCFVSRYLERMADHATNIGESVVYLVMGHRPDLN